MTDMFIEGSNNHFIMEISIARSHLETRGVFFSNISRTVAWESSKKPPCTVAALSSTQDFHRLASSCQAFTSVYPKRHLICRPNSMPISLQESASNGDNSLEGENPSIDSEEETLAQPPTREQIMALLADAQREQLTKKLSEANQQNRFLKRQLKVKEDALVKFKSELGVMELEIQALASLAEEIAQCGIPEGSRKINGKYIHSHLVARLEEYTNKTSQHCVVNLASFVSLSMQMPCFPYIAVHEKLKEQIKDVDAAQSKEVSVFWIGMAESVQVMGTFDGWSQGEHLSPEYNGSYTKFSTTLLLRPGRYEIKFLVDGEWQLSPEFPIIGEGLTKNNLLVVE
ncbi:protein PTST, chloroplastic isoform X2 [Vigna radiata var. radiata]|uniref:Protein PTST, chloroplastic isoform X2 n=1 Tax=Vigna radiata var. radiata TaxID=3916 RepID=A0A3Q0ETQ8_VIGRR|nr:protein PTST, chloroplastic isoform X2 [Vigna radiata var. radiata]